MDKLVLVNKNNRISDDFLNNVTSSWDNISNLPGSTRKARSISFSEIDNYDRSNAYLFDFLHIPTFITKLLINGMYKTVAWVVAVMLPPMAIFFPVFTLLEDLGYLPRIAFNLDNYFKKACTSGKQALTMCMGFGCNATGVVGSKIIDSPREKLIAMLTNAFVPCNGRFPLLITLSTIFIGSYFSRYRFYINFYFMCFICCTFRNIINTYSF